jgi:hypothetical protein
MKVSKGELVLSATELAAAPAALGLLVGSASRIPRVRSTPADEATVKAFFDDASEAAATLWRAAIATLARPVRTGVLHHGLAEETSGRAILAWGSETGTDAVSLADAGGTWSIRRMGVAEIVGTIRSILLDGVPLSPMRERIVVSQDAALVFQAVLHALRVGRLKALLDHDVSPVAFSPDAIVAAFDDAALDDFRWPLLFFDKVLPASLDGIEWESRVPAALDELARRGLVEKTKVADTWIPTPLGYRFVVADAQHLTRVGLRVGDVLDDEREAHETFLFERTLQDVSMVDLGGREAVIASLGFDDLDKLLTATLTPSPALLRPPRPESKAEPKPAPAEPARPAPRFCASCGAKLKAGAKFCGECGSPIRG